MRLEIVKLVLGHVLELPLLPATVDLDGEVPRLTVDNFAASWSTAVTVITSEGVAVEVPAALRPPFGWLDARRAVAYEAVAKAIAQPVVRIRFAVAVLDCQRIVVNTVKHIDHLVRCDAHAHPAQPGINPTGESHA